MNPKLRKYETVFKDLFSFRDIGYFKLKNFPTMRWLLTASDVFCLTAPGDSITVAGAAPSYEGLRAKEV
jgi:hypothetical protein